MAGTKNVGDDVKVKGKRPPSSRGRLDYFFNRNRRIRLGDHWISWTIGLGNNYVGFHVPLRSNPNSGQERANEILELLSDLVDRGYKHVPVGALTELKDSVSSSLIRGSTESSLRIDKFDAAIPLHNVCEGCRSYYLWDRSSFDWKLRFPRNIQGLDVPGRNVLLIAYSPRCTCRKEVADKVEDEDLEDLFV